MHLDTRAETEMVRFHEDSITEHIANLILPSPVQGQSCIEYYDLEERQYHGDPQALSYGGNTFRFKLPMGGGPDGDLTLFVQVEVKARII